ncbi:MAG: phosphatidylglycerol lysyltransferase domain-containing protein [Oscillospiraceae bacterium]|nr:phosphatidylglycerol lysyltransferase domain-containing protein [Oscillospiraceae bacterium]
MEFKQVTLDDRAAIERYLHAYGENSCQHTFPAMFCLAGKYGDAICEREDWLFTLRTQRGGAGYRTYLFPMGGGNLTRAMELLTADARANHARIRFETVTANAKAQLEARYPGRFLAQENRDMAEYLYAQERIAALSGHGLTTKRYECRAFWRNLGSRASIDPITPADMDDIRAFQCAWLLSKQADPNWVHLESENDIIHTALANFDALGLCGLVLRVDGEVRGFVYGSRISPDCLDMIAEKGDRAILGIYSVLNQEFAARCGAECRYLNWEEDVAVPGLRQAKLSYKPDILLQKYVLSEVAAD